jgi:hypothetical protein
VALIGTATGFSVSALDDATPQTDVSMIRPVNSTPSIATTPQNFSDPFLKPKWHPPIVLKTPAVKKTRLPRRISPPVKRPICHLDHDGDCDNDWTDYHPKPRYTPKPPAVYGYYNCAMLESLWRSVGGNSASAFVAAEIAMAESGGRPGAISPTNDFGLWQINGSHGALASLNPIANARAAVIISGNGSNWSPWTTYVSGAYIGRC